MPYQTISELYDLNGGDDDLQGEVPDLTPVFKDEARCFSLEQLKTLWILYWQKSKSSTRLDTVISDTDKVT